MAALYLRIGSNLLRHRLTRHLVRELTESLILSISLGRLYSLPLTASATETGRRCLTFHTLAEILRAYADIPIFHTAFGVVLAPLVLADYPVCYGFLHSWIFQVPLRQLLSFRIFRGLDWVIPVWELLISSVCDFPLPVSLLMCHFLKVLKLMALLRPHSSDFSTLLYSAHSSLLSSVSRFYNANLLSGTGNPIQPVLSSPSLSHQVQGTGHLCTFS